jgi:hypothetical protein
LSLLFHHPARMMKLQKLQQLSPTIEGSSSKRIRGPFFSCFLFAERNGDEATRKERANESKWPEIEQCDDEDHKTICLRICGLQ